MGWDKHERYRLLRTCWLITQDPLEVVDEKFLELTDSREMWYAIPDTLVSMWVMV